MSAAEVPAERLQAMAKILRDSIGKFAEDSRRYRTLVEERYNGWLPFKLAAKWETRAYWRARLSAWDEVYGATADGETLRLRSEWGAYVF